MSRPNIGIAAGMVILLILLQAFVLDGMEEKVREDELTQVSDLPAVKAMPTYLASLFMGSFRVVMLDVFWIQLKTLREDNRFFEAQQLMELISWLQPRNPEVWAMLGWDCTYNISMGGIESKEEQWKWIRYGFLKFEEGARRNPDTPYLSFEIGFRMWHRVTLSRPGYFNMELIDRMEKDEEFQRILQRLKPDDEIKAMSPFQISEIWLARARDQVLAIPTEERFSYFVTQMGLVLHPDTMDGYIRDSRFLHAMYCWQRGRHDEAIAYLKRASEQAEYVTRTYGDRVSKINAKMSKYYLDVIEAVEIHRDNGDKLRMASILHKAMQFAGPIDNGYVTENFLSPVLRELGQDDQEYNDGRFFARLMKTESAYFGEIGPQEDDLDSFFIWAPVPPFDRGTQRHLPFQPRRITLALSSKTDDVPFHMEVVDAKGKKLAEIDVPARERRKLVFTTPGPRDYYVHITSPKKGRYYLLWEQTELLPAIEHDDGHHEDDGHDH